MDLFLGSLVCVLSLGCTCKSLITRSYDGTLSSLIEVCGHDVLVAREEREVVLRQTTLEEAVDATVLGSSGETADEHA